MTRLHESGWLAEPLVGDVSSPDNSFDSSQESALSATATKRPSTNPDVTVPPSKRVAASHLQLTDSTHANPIDDRILSKRKGIQYTWPCLFYMHCAACYLLKHPVFKILLLFVNKVICQRLSHLITQKFFHYLHVCMNQMNWFLSSIS